MENVTHSLIGVVVGEGLARACPGERSAPGWRAGLLWASVVGSNLPDFDFLLRPIVGGGSLGYLLHHRGYTHTLALAVPLAFVAAGAGRFAASVSARSARRSKNPDGELKPAQGGAVPGYLLFLAGLLGVLCHVGADFWNDYGVHPFWPWLNRWFYGGFIFILEPLFWLSLLPFAYRSAQTRWARAICWALGLGILALAWFSGHMPWLVALALTGWGLGWAALHRRPRSVAWSLGAIAAILVVFASAGHVVQSRMRELLPPGEKLLGVSTSPAPSNPLCWRVVVTSRLAQPEGSPPTDYRARVGVKTLRPFGLGSGGGFGPNDAKRCSLRGLGENSALWAEVDAPSLLRPDLHWAGEFRGSLREFEQALATHCRLRALMRFVRMPFWLASPQGDLVAGDLRYHMGQGLGFADIASHKGEECYDYEPLWEFPSGLL